MPFYIFKAIIKVEAEDLEKAISKAKCEKHDFKLELEKVIP